MIDSSYGASGISIHNYHCDICGEHYATTPNDDTAMRDSKGPHLCERCESADTVPAPPPDFADDLSDDGRRPHGPHGERHEGPSTRAAE